MTAEDFAQTSGTTVQVGRQIASAQLATPQHRSNEAALPAPATKVTSTSPYHGPEPRGALSRVETEKDKMQLTRILNLVVKTQSPRRAQDGSHYCCSYQHGLLNSVLYHVCRKPHFSLQLASQQQRFVSHQYFKGIRMAFTHPFRRFVMRLLGHIWVSFRYKKRTCC